jgi:hypothetical protein
MSRMALSALSFCFVSIVPLQSYDEPIVSLIQTPRFVRLSLTGNSADTLALRSIENLSGVQKIVYMKGAIADPWVNTISTPSNNKINIIGPSQNFLRSRMNTQRSFISSSIRMAALHDFLIEYSF